MGRLVDGRWTHGAVDEDKENGRFARQPMRIRDWVTADGSSGFAPGSGRYHLYVSYACPWAHRTLIVRALKKLEAHISVSVVHPYMGEDGWTLDTDFPGTTGDPVNHKRLLHEVYTAAQPDFTGRVTVPVLWDRERATIVNNESSEIIRMLDAAFEPVTGEPPTLYPEHLRADIDALNTRIYDTVNNGVYKSGFASTQEAYDEAVTALFASLDWLEGLLADGRAYLLGDTLTEADVRLFTTLVRFDAVYVTHFKCNLRRLVDYPALWAYARRLYHLPEVRPTVHFDHIKVHYFRSHPTLNPRGIVPIGPELAW